MDQKREELRGRLRAEPLLPDNALVLRGGPDTVFKLQTHARRTARAWCLDGAPLFGISVFCALDDIGPASLHGLLNGRLRTYRYVHQCPVSALRLIGVHLVPLGTDRTSQRRSSPTASASFGGCLRVSVSPGRITFARFRREDGEEETVIVVDIAADLNDEDDTGLVWTFLDEARNPAIVVPGAIVVAGDADAPAVAEVVNLVEKPVGTIVHLRLLPGTFDDYEALIQRSRLPA